MGATIFSLGYKALAALEAISSKPHLEVIDRIVIGEDKNVQNDYSSAIRTLCLERCIPYETNYRSYEASSEVIIAIGWRWIIQQTSMQSLIVFHDSLLPKYRGFNPLVTALINGDGKIGVTALLGSADYDKGDVIAQESVAIDYPIKIGRAIEITGRCYASLFELVLGRIARGENIAGTPQLEESATYSLWRDDADYIINWNQPAARIHRMIDAVGYPYLGARTTMDGRPLFIDEVEEVKDVTIENRVPGKVIFKVSGKPVVVCSSGLLMINKARTIDGQLEQFEKKFRIRFQ